MLAKELYKVFIKQKGLFFILALLLLKVFFVVYNSYDSHYMIDENEAYYQDYIHKYGGKITGQKVKEIEAEYDSIYHKGTRSLAESRKEEAFQVIYHQYLYEKEKGGGSILDTRGWQSILEHDDLDFFLIISIIIISCMLFCAEYESEMDELLLSSREGKYHAAKTKILIGTASGAVLSLLFQLVHIFYLYVTVGLKQGGCMLCSLEMFEGTRYDISLSNAAFLVIFMRVFGGIFLAAAAMLLAVLLKKKSFSVIISFILVLIPELLFSEESYGYYIPFPLGLLRACGYLWPNLYESAITEHGVEKVCVFHHIPQPVFCGCLAVFMAMCLASCFLCFMFFSKVYYRFGGIRKNICCILIIAFAVFTMSGCKVTQKITESVKFQINDAERWQDECRFEGGSIAIDDEDNTIIYTDEKGEETDLIRNVFPLAFPIHNIYVNGKDCYYLMENDSDTGICIRKIDMDDFSDTLVYNSTEENTEDFYGLKTKRTDEENIFDNGQETKWFFVCEKYIYLKKKHYILQINIENGVKKTVAENVSDGETSYENGTLFYLDENGEQGVYEEGD